MLLPSLCCASESILPAFDVSALACPCFVDFYLVALVPLAAVVAAAVDWVVAFPGVLECMEGIVSG